MGCPVIWWLSVMSVTDIHKQHIHSMKAARNTLIRAYDAAFLATHVNSANRLRKEFSLAYSWDKARYKAFCVTVGRAYVACYKRNKMRTFYQWNNDQDWDGSPYVKPEPFKPTKAEYLYAMGRLGVRYGK